MHRQAANGWDAGKGASTVSTGSTATYNKVFKHSMHCCIASGKMNVLQAMQQLCDRHCNAVNAVLLNLADSWHKKIDKIQFTALDLERQSQTAFG